jgi:hypothetical protein
MDRGHVVGTERLVVQDRRLDLTRKHVDSSDDHHVVDPAGESSDLRVGPAARARIGDQSSHVAAAIADHREGLLRQGGQDQLAERALRDRVEGVGVDHFREEMIVEEMHGPFPFPVSRSSGLEVSGSRTTFSTDLSAAFYAT